MKKLLISMLVLTTLVTMVGCNDKKTGDTNSKPVENEQVANDSEIKKGRSNDEMYEIYEELLPSMRSYYESLGVDLKEDKSINEKVNDYFKGNGSDVIQREKGQYSERINLSNSQIAYMININP